ncbi:HAD family phosphatase [Streptacidiphilus sp. PB12-B1b]|uniref:HAD family hydrolase n=1 Tax=Streptacidiphilus sp. PB12-B1b TaxID=2705012 RepID=UPI0015FA4943|nr:HAD family phosphatase [Streptacidiphilus sp. PB12-B1b]QMU76306.1 HAD family phosphatase [Streptacidiphilus sp. PB12-B1b]
MTTYASTVSPDRESTGLQAVLLDMDGTLVDTEDLWWEAECSLLAEHGHVLGPADRQAVVGGPMSRVVAHLLAVSGADLTAELFSAMINERFTQMIAGGVPLRPGAAALLAELAAEGVPTALVSAAHRRIIDLVLRSLGGHPFGFTVAGDEVERTKPHPDPYLLAAARLGADPARCVVIEDAPTGVRAGEAAGCRVLAVPSVTPIEALPGRTVLESLEGVSVALLRGLVPGTDRASR